MCLTRENAFGKATIIPIIIHLLGLAPAGYVTAPDNGPEGLMRGGACQVPNRRDGCLAVPLNSAESDVERKPHRTLALEEKDYDPGLRKGDIKPHAYPVDPEPTTPRKRPAQLPIDFVERYQLYVRSKLLDGVTSPKLHCLQGKTHCRSSNENCGKRWVFGLSSEHPAHTLTFLQGISGGLSVGGPLWLLT
jgi:hypothetical protein